jgi:REP element-mobilizing transposase RayT
MMNDHSNQRRSIRLKYYNYRQSGAYFVTIVTQDRRCLFGDVVNGKMRLNDPGHMVLAVWEDLSSNYLGVETDHFVAMPNHVHGVIVLVGVGARTSADSGGQPQGVAPTKTGSADAIVTRCLSLSDVIHRFKTLTTQRYALGVNGFGWTRFNHRLWQRNYFEHVIRNEESLLRIRQYIADNPARWEFDRENPGTLHPEAKYAWRD